MSDANYDLLKEPLEGKKRSSLPGTIPSDEAKVWRHHYDLLALFGKIEGYNKKGEKEIRCRTFDKHDDDDVFVNERLFEVEYLGKFSSLGI